MLSSAERRKTIKLPSTESVYGLPEALVTQTEFLWDESLCPIENYHALGSRLAKCPDLFRHGDYGSGLVVVPASGRVRRHNLRERARGLAATQILCRFAERSLGQLQRAR